MEEILKEKNNIIKKLEEIINQKDNIINDLKIINNTNKDKKEIIEKKDCISQKNEKYNNKTIDNNKIFKDFNIVNHNPKKKLTSHENKAIFTIIQLQDGRLASGGDDGSVIIYNHKTFEPEITIEEYTKTI